MRPGRVPRAIPTAITTTFAATTVASAKLASTHGPTLAQRTAAAAATVATPAEPRDSD